MVCNFTFDLYYICLWILQWKPNTFSSCAFIMFRT